MGKVVTSLSTFIILGLVARNYGEEGTGVFTLVLTYLAIFYLLSDFGFNAHVLKKVTGDRVPVRQAQGEQVTGEWQKLLGTRVLWSLFLVGISVAVLPFWPFATASFSQAVLFGGLAIIASGVFVTCNLIFQAKLRYELSVLSSSFGTLIGLAVFVYLIYINIPIHFLLLGHLAGWVFIALPALIMVRRLVPSVSPIFHSSYIVNLFKQSWPIAGTLLLNVVYFRVDSFLISIFRNNVEVGIYNIAYSVFQTELVLPTFILNAYYPIMLKSLNGIKVVGLGFLALAILGMIFTIIFAPFVIRFLTGGGFTGSTESLKILSLGFPAYFMSALLMWMMVTKDKYKSMFVIYAVGLFANLVLNFIYIPRYSFFAASWITVISEYLILGLQVVTLKRGKIL